MGFYPVDLRIPKERRVIEFLLPILYPIKPKRLNITMANTIFGALFVANSVNWRRFIQELVEKSIPHIGKKPSPLSSYLFHLSQQNGCVNKVEEDVLTFAKDEVTYKPTPITKQTESRNGGITDRPHRSYVTICHNHPRLKEYHNSLDRRQCGPEPGTSLEKRRHVHL
jgi:hypothetical protein